MSRHTSLEWNTELEEKAKSTPAPARLVPGRADRPRPSPRPTPSPGSRAKKCEEIKEVIRGKLHTRRRSKCGSVFYKCGFNQLKLGTASGLWRGR